jgi:hypothetical protein
MLAALDATAASRGAAPELVARVREHLVQAADFMVNER